MAAKDHHSQLMRGSKAKVLLQMQPGNTLAYPISEHESLLRAAARLRNISGSRWIVQPDFGRRQSIVTRTS